MKDVKIITDRETILICHHCKEEFKTKYQFIHHYKMNHKGLAMRVFGKYV